MELKKEKLVMFYSDGKHDKEILWGKKDPIRLEKSSSVDKVSSSLLKADNMIVGAGTKLNGNSKIGRSKVFPEDLAPWQINIYVSFLKISELSRSGPPIEEVCSTPQGIIACLFLKYIPASENIMKIVIWFIIPATRSSRTDHKNNALALIVLLQYVPRLYLIFPLSSEIIKATGVVTRTAWAGAAYNLLLYMLASHVLGASWYLLSIDRYTSCWKSQCRKENSPVKCLLSYLDCDTFNDGERKAWANATTVFKNCDPDNDITFKYGIFENAVKKSAVSSKFIEKYLYCLWWGLQQLRERVMVKEKFCLTGKKAYWNKYVVKLKRKTDRAVRRVDLLLTPFIPGQNNNLSTSTFIGETSFAVLISILGLVLFAHLIGNMQTYLQSLTVRLEEWRLKRRDTEEWMKHRQLPEDLRKRVRRFVQYKWLATRGVNEESILRGLPADLRRDIQCHLCLDLVRRVPFFSQMDDQLLDAICERLVSSLSTEGTYIVREGDPVTEMLFIIRGRLESSTTNGGRTGFFNSIMLKPGDFCGEELLSWALHPKSSLNLPSSTRTVKALNEVEGFALRAEDLKFVANQFRRLHSKKLQHTFRYHSHHWRTWAACFIQAAWRRHKKRMVENNLTMSESFVMNEREATETEQEDEAPFSDHSNPSQARLNLGVTILASRFAANTRRGAQKMKDVEMPKLPKPDEPDFTSDVD
ncbi:hypothetical protein OIU84_000691 [Salix udensis]|uniref:Cyclic nucleotide-binding domain-containing protein n=1 Tax=Salix udensis TaxID=889485 RepID=A0AAD6L5J7_9ROSI|nr:hypothetical protein OIU84_000691 [Salix udensis]